MATRLTTGRGMAAIVAAARGIIAGSELTAP